MKFCQACKVTTDDDTATCSACGESCWSAHVATEEHTDDGSGEPFNETTTEPQKPPMPRRRR